LRLAPIEGSGSLSGHILSHDFVEAALMRRAGWKVWVADELDGSYEQVPPNLLAELQRDRRWCHGNLQNSRLMFEPGLHAVHRTAFLTGVLAYASSPLWLAFLLLSTFCSPACRRRPDLLLRAEPAVPDLADGQPQADADLVRPDRACCCSPPRCCRWSGSWCAAKRAASADPPPDRQRPGRVRALLLLAPVRMLFHTQFVLAALTGWRLDWKSPPRDDASTGWREAASRHGAHTVLAVLWIVAIVVSSNSFAWWLSPILLGLLSAIPLSVWGSRVAAGAPCARHGLLLTREIREPRVLAAAARGERSPRAGDVQGRGRRRRNPTSASPRCRAAALRVGPKCGRVRAIERALREGPTRSRSTSASACSRAARRWRRCRRGRARTAPIRLVAAPEPAHAAEPPRRCAKCEGMLAESL
jgi:membrane glycosyltransferase